MITRYLEQWKARRVASMRAERGIVLPMFGIFLGAMLGAAGFGIDLGNWYLQADRLQRGADAAALAGSTYLPNNLPSAQSVARTSLQSNGVPTDRANITQSSLHPTQLQVSVTRTVNNYVINAIGIDTMTFTRRATGEFRPFVPMGSPSNVLGQEPQATDSWESDGDKNNYWLNISGGSSFKDNGDRWSAGACNSGTDRCTTGMAIPTGNSEYSEDGQIYVVRVNDGASGQLRLQAFDAGFAHVGDHCGSNLSSVPSTPENRYQAGDTNPFCTGDNLIGASGNPTNTTYELWTPADSPGGSRPIATTGCTARTFTGVNTGVGAKLSSDPTFRAWFRQWSTLCTLQIGSNYPPGDYLLHVSTPVDQRGLNRFALRTAFLQSNGAVDRAASKNVAIFSQGRLVIYALTQSSDVPFYLARITSAAAGHTMTVTLFDIGDAAQPVTMRIVPPDDSGLSRFNGCTYNKPNTTTMIATSTGCQVSSAGGGWNARIVNIDVPIPADYSCDDADPDGCWTKIQVTFSSGNVQDTSSWEVGLDGQPVHLVPNSAS